MQLISGPVGKERVLFEAPAAKKLNDEMKAFIEWYNHPPKNIDGLIRAAIVHFFSFISS